MIIEEILLILKHDTLYSNIKKYVQQIYLSFYFALYILAVFLVLWYNQPAR
jgi:hypothetical protein